VAVIVESVELVDMLVTVVDINTLDDIVAVVCVDVVEVSVAIIVVVVEVFDVVPAVLDVNGSVANIVEVGEEAVNVSVTEYVVWVMSTAASVWEEVEFWVELVTAFSAVVDVSACAIDVVVPATDELKVDEESVVVATTVVNRSEVDKVFRSTGSVVEELRESVAVFTSVADVLIVGRAPVGASVGVESAAVVAVTPPPQPQQTDVASSPSTARSLIFEIATPPSAGSLQMPKKRYNSQLNDAWSSQPCGESQHPPSVVVGKD
jgi:biotin synthase-related radical SAM superfamily protein